MGANVKRKNPAAVALGRKGGKKGGVARAAKLTAVERSASARKAVQGRWAKANGTVPPPSAPDASKKALHLCLKRIKDAKSESEIRRLTEELQRIVFHRQYLNAEG